MIPLKRRGFFFTTDVMLCIIVLVIGFILVWSSFTEEPPKEQPYFLAEDVATIMATTKNIDILDKIGPFVADYTITNLEHTMFEQIGEFYVTNRLHEAWNYSKEITENILPTQYSIAIMLENLTIYNQSRTVSQNQSTFLLSSKRMVVIVLNQSQLFGPYLAEVRVW